MKIPRKSQSSTPDDFSAAVSRSVVRVAAAASESASELAVLSDLLAAPAGAFVDPRLDLAAAAADLAQAVYRLRELRARLSLELAQAPHQPRCRPQSPGAQLDRA